MFNTKRIKALGERIEDIKEAINKRIEYWQKEQSDLKKDVLFLKHYIDKNYAIPCSTCKCLIRKEDAIRGESEIVKKYFGKDFAGLVVYLRMLGGGLSK